MGLLYPNSCPAFERSSVSMSTKLQFLGIALSTAGLGSGRHPANCDDTLNQL
jgi:hypothetical protein